MFLARLFRSLAADTRRRSGHRMLLDVDLLAWTLDTLTEHHPRRERTIVATYPAVCAAASTMHRPGGPLPNLVWP
ncbi:hypothetical protein CYJ73_25955 [Gordonia terrae]|uniref:Uncharacterized protein n=1 Tax=Gordonia terrae TaxID=2055 RepID=A0A2I1R0K5_9ACTN|nr:hypothetical protein CYJ73_25955 [Gordonia terrae]